MRTTATGAFFATSPYLRSRPAAGQRAGGQDFEVHAKAMGTNVTLCGRSTYTWAKLWNVPFTRARGSRCGACVDAMLNLAPRSQERLARR